jgi:hypothetical protein
MPIQYPLTATFKLLALSPEVQVRDAAGNMMLQVKQKALTLREDTTVFADEKKTVPLYRMVADRAIGFRAVHRITRLSDNTVIGAVKATGFRSLWKTQYDVTGPQDEPVFTIREENAWIKFIDAMVDELPFGFIFSAFINPRYLLTDETGVVRYRITKKRSFIERNFILEQVSPDTDEGLDERLVALALIQTIFLERHRG